MARLFVAALLLAALPAAAAACPQLTSKTGAFQLSARDLATPRIAAVRAGGTVVLEGCASVPGHGHVPFAPTAVVDFRADQRGRALEVRTQGACDSVLLVRTARGRWYFDDDNGTAGGAKLTFANPATGRYRIWVGSYGPFGCDTELVLRSIRPGR